MIIGGLEKFTLLDYPDHLSAVIFTQGCNFRCHFCYNPMLVVPLSNKENDKLENKPIEAIRDKGHLHQIDEDSLFLFLKSRVGKLDGVVISGGEPTLHDDLPDFISKIKELGFKVKLDTNGTRPDVLEGLIEAGQLDYVAMDIKASENKYRLATGVEPNIDFIKKSIKILKESQILHEFRTTLVPGLHTTDDVYAMGAMIDRADKWYLQKFQSDMALVNKDFQKISLQPAWELEKMLVIASAFAKICKLR